MVDKINLIALDDTIITLFDSFSNTSANLVNVTSNVVNLTSNVVNLTSNLTRLTSNVSNLYNVSVRTDQNNNLNSVALFNYRGNTTNLNNITYTMGEANTGRIFWFSNSLANVTVTLEASANAGTYLTCIQGQTKNVRFVAASGGSVFHRLNHQNTSGRYAMATVTVALNETGTSANWILTGDTTT